MQESFSPKQQFLKQIHLWWVPFVFACAGALIGLFISFIAPSKYEAQAEINLAVDFSKIGLVTDIEQDQIIEMVADICKSDQVFAQVTENYAEFDAVDFYEMAELERRNMKLVLKVRHSDAEFAGELVRAWQSVSYDEIQTAYEHAIMVESLADYLNTLTGCFEQNIGQANGTTACNLLSVPELQDEMTKIAEQIREEQQLSQGISPAISVSVTNSEIQPAQKVSNLLGWLVLAGGFIGFLIGIWGIPFINNRSVKS